MKVVHLIKTGVGATWALRQIRILIGEGVEVHVILGEDGPMYDRYIAAGAHVHRMPIDIARVGVKGFASAARRLKDKVEEIGPDLIHSHFFGTTIFARLVFGRSAPIPRVFQVPGPLHLEKRLTRLADLRTAGRADYWCASCDLTRRIYLKAGIDRARVSLSFYGTDIHALPQSTQDPQELRRKIGVPDGASVVGMVAYMYPPKRFFGQKTGLKGHEDLIEAIGLLRDDGRNVAGVFVGGAWAGAVDYEAQLRQLGKDRLGPHGIFLGNRDDVPALYRGFDLVAHPSHSENLGGAAESLLLGIPTIASNVGGFPDIVRHGETGLLVNPNAPKELARAIAQMLDSPSSAAQMGASGRNLASNLLDVERTGVEIASIYRDVTAIHATSRSK